MFKKNLMSKLLPGLMRSVDEIDNSTSSKGSKDKSVRRKSNDGSKLIEQRLVKRGKLDSEFLIK